MRDLKTNNIDNVNAKKDAENEVAMSIEATSHCRNWDSSATRHSERWLRWSQFNPESDPMKRPLKALLFGTLALASQLAHADIIDDAIGNVQQAISDAYKPNSDNVYHDDRDDNNDNTDNRRQDSDRDRQYDDRYRQLEDRRRQLDDRQRQLDQERHQLDDEESRLRNEYDR